MTQHCGRFKKSRVKKEMFLIKSVFFYLYELMDCLIRISNQTFDTFSIFEHFMDDYSLIDLERKFKARKEHFKCAWNTAIRAIFTG